MFCLSIPSHFSFSSILVSLKLLPCRLIHTQASLTLSNTVQLLFQPLSPTSHTHIAFLLYVRSLYHLPIHTPCCLYTTVSPKTLLFLLSLANSISTNPFAAQFSSPINFLQNLPSTLSSTFHASFNPHISILYPILDSHTIS